MVKRQGKIAISIVFHVVTVAARFILQFFGHTPRHRLIILYYHALPAGSRDRFARQLDRLARYTNVVRADLSGPGSSGGHSVAITFDDAFVSVIDHAIPELRARGMPATIFVPAGRLGGPPNWEREDPSIDAGETVATVEALRSLSPTTVTLGAHSLTHPRLSRLCQDDARREIAGCRQSMRDLFGRDVRLFAFPYGDYDTATMQLCREAGYERVFTVEPYPVDPNSEEFARGRITVGPDDGRLEFYLKMSGAYAWMPYASAAKKRLIKLVQRRSGNKPAG